MSDDARREPAQVSTGEMGDDPEASAGGTGTPRELPPSENAPEAPSPAATVKMLSRLKPVTRIPWKRIEEGLSAVRSFTLTTLLLASLIALIGFTVVELRREVVVIDPLKLPAPLKNMGYSEDVAALRLWDAVVQINDATPTAKDRVSLLAASQRVDFEAPGAGMSMQSIVGMMRRFLELDETRIAGEFICATTSCETDGLSLRLRVFRGDRMDIIHLAPLGVRVGDATGHEKINRYFEAAALELLRELDPYVVAFYLYQHDKEASEREALKLIAPNNPQLKWSLNLLGLITAQKGDYEAAFGWFERAIEADQTGSFALAHINWGDALASHGNIQAAVQKFERATEIDPQSWLALLGWGRALAANGDPDEAIKKYRGALSLASAADDPDLTEVHISFGDALLMKGDLEGAARKYAQATEIDPNNADAFFNWGIALRDAGDTGSAITKFIQASELDPKDVSALLEWGFALQKQADLPGAAEKFTRAVKLEPKNPIALNSLGATMANLGDLAAAVELFAEATGADPTYADAYLNKGIAFGMLERSWEAADALQRYLDLKPDASNAEWLRAQIDQLRQSAQN